MCESLDRGALGTKERKECGGEAKLGRYGVGRRSGCMRSRGRHDQTEGGAITEGRMPNQDRRSFPIPCG